MKKFVSAVVPMYNEFQSCISFIVELSATLEELAGGNYEIIAPVGGTDGTYEKLLDLRRRGYHMLQIYYDSERGLGRGLARGFGLISNRAAIVVTMDADGSHTMTDLKRMLKAYKGEDVLIGARSNEFQDTRSWKKKLVSKAANVVMSRLYGGRLSDFTSDFRIYRAAAIRDIRYTIRQKNFEAVPEILFCMKDKGYAKAKELPIAFDRRRSGESKLTSKTVWGFGILIARRIGRYIRYKVVSGFESL